MSDDHLKIKKGTEQLGGFEDIIDLLPSKAEQKSRAKVADSFEFITYVENEEDRLRAIESYCVQKRQMLKEHPQAPSLLRQQEQRKEAAINEILAAIQTDKKEFQVNLAKLWEQFFS